MKKLKPLALTGIIAATSLFGTGVSAATSNNYDLPTIQESKAIEEETQTVGKYYKYVEEELRKYDVSETKIDNLIKKLKDGALWDSVNPEMEGTATEVKLDEFTTKFEYPDGSVFIQVLDESEATIETVEPPKDGMITPYASIGGGSAISGSGYVVVTGAKVSGSVILAGAQYKVDYTIINGGYDTISSAYSRNITVPGPGGNYEIESWGVKKAKEDAGGKAYVSLRFKAQNSSLGASTMYLNTYVGGDKATVSSNM